MAEGSFNVCSIDNFPDLSICSGLLKLVFDSMFTTVRISFSHTCTHRCTNVWILTDAHVFEFLDVVANQPRMKCVCNQCTASHDEMCHQVGNVSKYKVSTVKALRANSYKGYDIMILTMVR